nr:MAG TPA: hypothetical protein [Caudoviricetes sp.]
MYDIPLLEYLISVMRRVLFQLHRTDLILVIL